MRISLVLIESSNHALEPNIDKVIFSDSSHDAESFKVEDNFIGSFDIFEDVWALLCKLAKFKDDIFVFIHMFDELLDEGSYFFPQTDI